MSKSLIEKVKHMKEGDTGSWKGILFVCSKQPYVNTCRGCLFQTSETSHRACLVMAALNRSKKQTYSSYVANMPCFQNDYVYVPVDKIVEEL